MRTGNVVGSLPDGATSPESTSASACPHSSPANQHCKTAPTCSAQPIATGDAALTTTAVRGLAAATARTSSSCGGGKVMSARSVPSVSQSPSVPTTHTTTSACAASATARSSASAGDGGRQPIASPPIDGAGSVYS